MIFITFRSVTYAQRGEKALRRAGIPGILQRTPRSMESRGCGYCLRIRKNGKEAVKILSDMGIPFRKVFVQRKGEEPEEMIV